MKKKINKAGAVRYFLALFLPISIVISVALFSAYKIEVNSFKKLLLVNETHIAHLYLESIKSLFNNAMKETLLLSRGEEIKRLLSGKNGSTLDNLKNEIEAFCELNPSCSGVSILNSSGKEVAGIKTGALLKLESEPVTYEALHARSMKLNPGEVYFSPVENGFGSESVGTEKKEQIRIITPVFNEASERTGSVQVTLLAETLIDDIKTPGHDSINQHLIIDQNGYILYGGPLLKNNNFTLREVTGHNFASLHPGLWQKISGAEFGQFDAANHTHDDKTDIEDKAILHNGFYTFMTLNNTEAGFSYKDFEVNEEPSDSSYTGGEDNALWKIITYLPREVLLGIMLQKKYLLGEAGLILLTFIFCLFYATHRFNKMKVEAKLRAQETRYRMIHQSAFDGIVLANNEGVIVESNPSMEEIFGYSKEKLIGVNINILLPEKLRNNKNKGFNRFTTEGGDESLYKVIQINGLHSSGETFPMELTVNRIEIEGSFFIACTIRDIRERKTSEETINKLAYYDRLTGLPNRSLFNDRFNQALVRAKRSGLTMGLLLLDFDRFKAFKRHIRTRLRR